MFSHQWIAMKQLVHDVLAVGAQAAKEADVERGELSACALFIPGRLPAYLVHGDTGGGGGRPSEGREGNRVGVQGGYASRCRLHKLCINLCMGALGAMFRASEWVSGVFQWAVECWVLLLGLSGVCFMLESASNNNRVTRYSLAKSICKVGAIASGACR